MYITQNVTRFALEPLEPQYLNKSVLDTGKNTLSGLRATGSGNAPVQVSTEMPLPVSSLTQAAIPKNVDVLFTDTKAAGITKPEIAAISETPAQAEAPVQPMIITAAPETAMAVVSAVDTAQPVSEPVTAELVNSEPTGMMPAIILPAAVLPAVQTAPAQKAVSLPQAPPKGQVWQVENLETGRARIDLDSNYRLTVDENSKTVSIDNFSIGTETIIWGERPVVTSLNGDTDFLAKEPLQFWATTTFVLDNGARITVETKASPQNSDVYMLDRVLVTKGDRAVIIEGAGNVDTGDMVISSNNDGWYVDLETADNFVIRENGQSGILSAGEKQKATALSQNDLDNTAAGEKYGGKNPRYSLNDIGKIITEFVSGSVTTMLRTSNVNATLELQQENSRDDAKRQAINAAAERILAEREIALDSAEKAAIRAG